MRWDEVNVMKWMYVRREENLPAHNPAKKAMRSNMEWFGEYNNVDDRNEEEHNTKLVYDADGDGNSSYRDNNENCMPMKKAIVLSVSNEDCNDVVHFDINKIDNQGKIVLLLCMANDARPLLLLSI
ncbi:hypothetical protein Cni_G29377 [Canna indica]|uniref:Uncharacterized protein n=1 Tax=Canna indica TaxID=4628 RepID=A0AAQ3L758_9LILI|nr:hypothetical protein Cni_G29377 [Canna indica]